MLITKIKLEFIDSPTEQTTAITDGVLAVIALAALIYLQQVGPPASWKMYLWSWAFGWLALGAVLGAVVHGFKISNRIKEKLWALLYLCLGLTVAFFVVGVVFDIWGLAAARQILPFMLLVGFGFAGLTLIWVDSFLIFIVYQAVAMLFALGGYLWLAIGGSLEGAWFMVGGILVTLFAAAIQASHKVSLTFIWKFDHNGVYHLIQMVGLVLLIVGLRASLLTEGTH
jgi:hypothetical protein